MGPIIGLLLAAGQGRRFGSDKLLHPLDDGTPMAVRAARSLKAACPRSIAVLRPEQTVLAGLLAEEGLQPVFSAAARGGMGHSLAAGVAASPAAGGWLVAL
ncbi:NTP transferase domain-containing protein, partial [Zoogloea sp.]|uniref:NTP transferase domain-containing protein n=1 Tax=Zoogloea sp. TaxID=49181 RepID=UPI0035B46CFB